jgi:hypothetical protein
MLAKLYKMLWNPTTQRPWTYAIRQTAGWKSTLAVLVAVALLLWLLTVSPIASLTLGVASGFLAGHLWWDTKGSYIKHKEYFKENDDVKW